MSVRPRTSFGRTLLSSGSVDVKRPPIRQTASIRTASSSTRGVLSYAAWSMPDSQLLMLDVGCSKTGMQRKGRLPADNARGQMYSRPDPLCG